MKLVAIFVGLCVFDPIAALLQLNVTRVDNCPNKLNYDYPVQVQDIKLVSKDDFVDSILGAYVIKSNDFSDRDIVVKLFKCNEKINKTCAESVEKRVYASKCENYLKEKGPWSVLTDVMTGPHCSHPLGTFEFNHTRLESDLFEGHMTVDAAEFKHYRLTLEFWARNNVDLNRDDLIEMDDYETLNGLRACVEMDFSIIFD